MTMLMHHMLRAAAGYAAPTPPSTDPQFNYVTMLLHGDGTNGAQNNTFVDSSTNNFTITRNGTPTQGSFSPYGDLWSNYFNGSSYLTAASNAAFAMGTSDFTLECWYNPAPKTALYPLIAGNHTTAWAANAWELCDRHASASTKFIFQAYNYSSSTPLLISTTTVVIGVWYHIAVTRSGNVWRLFINGVLEATTTASFSADGGSSHPFQIGRGDAASSALIGSVSNLRLVKGTALYTSNFTPSTTPLTAVSGTSLLTCQSNRFRDNSSNNFAINVTGAPSVQRFSPFDPAAEYSTSVIGGSGYFGTSGQSVQAASNAAFTFGTGDFTVEYFVYAASWSSSPTIVDLRSSNPSSGGYADYYSTAGKFNLYWGTTTVYTSAATLGLNQWHHIAVSRSGSTVRVFVNGVLDGTFTNAFNFTDSNCRIGANTNATPAGIVGYLSDTRIVKGTAVYTAAFTPPTAPLTAITNTSLLLNTVNAGIYDNAMMNDLVTVGNAQISTSVKKYGTGSMAFDLIDDCLVAPSSTNFQYGAGDFTVEFWLYFASLPSLTAIIFDQRTAATQVVPTLYYDTNNLYYLTNGAVRISGAFTTAGAWVHVALCRSAGSTRLFVNGVQLGSTYTDANNYVASPVYVGARWDLQGELNGYIDDLRITKGYARYTANFTPPTAAFPNN